MSNPTDRLFVGVDPGKHGSIVFTYPGMFGQGLWIKHVYDMPLKGGKVDPVGVVNILRERSAQTVLVTYEDNHQSFGNEGRSSLWAFAACCGALPYVMEALNLRALPVGPKTWKAHYGLIGSTKKGSLELARKMFPGSANLLTRAKDEGRAEALLIAHYGYEMVTKRLK